MGEGHHPFLPDFLRRLARSMTPAGGGMQPSIPTKSGLRFTLTVLVYANLVFQGKTFFDENTRFLIPLPPLLFSFHPS